MTVRKRAGKADNADAAESNNAASKAATAAVDHLTTLPPEPRVLTKEAQELLDNAARDLPMEKWEGVQLNLGLPWGLVRSVVGLEPSVLKKVLALISAAVLPLEIPIFWLLRRIPAAVMNKVLSGAFKLLVKLWALLPDFIARRGIHKNMSIESHLLMVFMWPSRLFPMTLRRIRFGMGNLAWFIPPDLDGVKEELIDLPERGVRGLWLHTAPKDVKDPPVFFWVFGGAFVAGDIKGNRGFAARYARQLGADAFIMDYRLLPENTIAEAFRDGTRAYEYVLSRKSPNKIMTGGISAGAGLLVNALQCANSTDPKLRKWAFHGTDPTPQPAGAMLIGPFVNFAFPVTPEEAIVKNTATDPIVTQRVLELCAPLLIAGEGSQERLRGLSPLNGDLSGLCPMHISYSRREATTDMCDELVEKLKAVGNDVDVWTTPYLGHVFQVLLSFVPEALEAETAAVNWMRKYLKSKSK